MATKSVWLKRALFLGGVAAAGGAAAYAVADYLLSAPRHRGPESDHYREGQFYNPVRTERHNLVDFLRWRMTGRRGKWRRTEAGAKEAPPAEVEAGGLRVTYIGHATTLVQTEGLNLLTDPIWSERASPVRWVGPRRMRPPGIRFEDLPRVGAVLISHNHYDHLDLRTLRRLVAEHDPRIVVPLGNRRFLESKGIKGVTELDWWESVRLPGGQQIFCVPARHFSCRSLSDRDGTLWCGYVIKSPSGLVYFAGDTAAGPHFEQIRERFGHLRLALLPIAPFLPGWFMSPAHISPEEAVGAHEVLNAGTSVAIHFGTFALGDDGENEAAETLRRVLNARGGSEDRFWVLDFGEGRDLPPVA